MSVSSWVSVALQKRRSKGRVEAFGQEYRLTPVDRCGIWLSARQVRRYAGFAGKRVGEFGCGYQASFARTVLDEAAHVSLIDVSLADDLKRHQKIWAMEGRLPESLAAIPSESLDVVLCVSVLEHLWEPVRALLEFRRMLAPGGVCLLNVPSWRGKPCLELAALRLGFSTTSESDEHKTHYHLRLPCTLLAPAGVRSRGAIPS